jgi:hypothetical protein
MLSVYRTGALKNLTDIIKDYKIDVTAVQEVRWVGQIILEKDCQYITAATKDYINLAQAN